MKSDSAEYVIVGGGIAGLSLADKLSAEGHDCLVLEAGSSNPVGDWRKLKWYDETRDLFEVDSSRAYNVQLSRVKALGGGTEAWEGYIPRWNETDFKLSSKFGVGKDWPFGYEEIEPYYSEAEYFLGAAGEASNPADSFRSKPYPLPPFEWSPYEKGVACRSKHIGVVWHPYPQARNSRPYGRRSNCNEIGTCNLCPIQARWSPRATLVPRLASRSNVRIETDATCRLARFDSRGNPEAVLISRKGGEERWVEFSKLILASGAIECSRWLLLIRRSMVGRDGFWSNPRIGTGYMDHPVIRVRADLDWHTGYSRQTNILATSHHFREYEPSTGAWGFCLNLNRRDLPRLWLAAHFEMPAVEENCIRLSSESLDCFGDPVARLKIGTDFNGFESTTERIHKSLQDVALAVGGRNLRYDPLQLWACHPMGGCSISNSEKEGVVDSNLKIWGTENCYVLSNGVFASGASVNPTLTLLSLSFRLSKHLLQNEGWNR
ncbi:GMC oxidoreductase [Pelagicoccus albus]|uniref:GMC family oxidoreductase n=1 Tax=Pelagicoccus albus TaxID=415222 RepID=A0A7X1B9M0_9BACT|nr:GMC family oxidoreductase [Pelagicoccus albus]MBC2606943.1 GMC family oxidoreductase [Pelagicoccus albus]